MSSFRHHGLDRSTVGDLVMAAVALVVAGLVRIRLAVRSTFDAAVKRVRMAIGEARSRGQGVQVYDPEGKHVAVATMGVLANYAIQLLITLIVLMVAILVGGQFAGAVPTDNPFSTALQTTIDTASTAFEIFGVTLIVIPGIAAIALIVAGLAFGSNRMSGAGGRT